VERVRDGQQAQDAGQFHAFAFRFRLWSRQIGLGLGD
jgi:hypothetical protein